MITSAVRRDGIGRPFRRLLFYQCRDRDPMVNGVGWGHPSSRLRRVGTPYLRVVSGGDTLPPSCVGWGHPTSELRRAGTPLPPSCVGWGHPASELCRVGTPCLRVVSGGDTLAPSCVGWGHPTSFRSLPCSAVGLAGAGEFEILAQRALWADAEFPQHSMVGFDRFLRGDFPVHDAA